jgi:hypothetical protein
MKDKKPDEDFSLEEEIHQYYSHDQLDDIYRRYFSDFLKTASHYFSEWNLDQTEFEGLAIRKRELVRLVAITLSDSTIFAAWLERLPYMVTRVLETITWEGKQPIEALNARTKGDIVLSSAVDTLELETINPAYCLFLPASFPHWTPDGSPVIGLDLPATVRKKCKRYLPTPKGYTLRPLKSPEDTAFLFVDRELTLQSIGIVHEFVQQGRLESTKSGLLRKQSLSRLGQQTGLTEFYIDAADSSLKLLRIELIAHLFSQPFRFVDSLKPHEILKSLFAQFGDQPEPVLVRLLEHVKGWYHATRLMYGFHQQTMCQLMKHLPVQKWISVKQLLRYALVRSFDLCPVNPEAYRYLYTTSDWKGWGHTKHPVYGRVFSEIIVEPYVKATLFLFAAFGLLDIHYDLPRDGIDLSGDYHFFSVFDGLKYLRLTQLGAYVFELNDAFEPQLQQQDATNLYLDEERLLITLSRTDDRMESVLEKLATRIGRTRFRFDYQSMLHGCFTERDIKAKTDLFYGLVGRTLPRIWEDFIGQINKKSKALTLTEDYLVFKVNPVDSELLDLFSQDEEIRSFLRLSEDFHILVAKKDVAQLKKKLLIFGYLF